jgi:hypothetical protein
MRDNGVESLELAGEMQTLLQAQNATTTILAASIRDAEEVAALGIAGVGSVTLPPAILARLLESEATARDAAVFHQDALAILEHGRNEAA